tara:strand:- start:2015 stop:2308 length:294 start_codon:yes stop_codon:yes gene_type:complete
MTQADIIEAIKGFHPEIDTDGVDIVYSDGKYDYDVRYTAWDYLFEIEIFSVGGETPLIVANKTISVLFDYVSELHREWSIGLKELRDTQDYLDIYER